VKAWYGRMALAKWCEAGRSVTGKACDKLIDNLLFCTDVVAWSESIEYLGIHFYYGCTLDIDISHMMRRLHNLLSEGDQMHPTQGRLTHLQWGDP